jgi:phospholipase D1/2
MFKPILQPGRNCWRIRHADRLAFLIDGDAYFSALYSALQQASRDIMILSWDIYSELRLGALQHDQRSLASLLVDALHKHQHLKAHILNWDFSVLFAAGREWLPSYKLGWKGHPRLAFHLDDQHPTGASHHQKVVTLDNVLAFCGGIDLTRGRWDTPEHQANNPRREMVDGTLGRPYHDIQIAILGDAAGALTDLARDRWSRATNMSLAKVEPGTETLWPKGLEADLQDVEVAISRTEPAYQDYKEVREVEQLFLDAIAAAQHYIYIENQYFASSRICDAMAERLREKEGPEIIINLPLETQGWLAQNSMDIIRIKLIQRLREADQYHRFAVYYPYRKDQETLPINLHAKLMIIDDRFVRVGSANINNRSMGLDTECDISIECRPDNSRISEGLKRFRNRLLSEHLSTSRDHIRQSIESSGSLISTIESLRKRNSQRTLRPLEPKLPHYSDTVLTKSELVDPEQPANVDKIFYHAILEEEPTGAALRIKAWVASLLVLILLALAWHYTPLGDWLDINTITQTIEVLKKTMFAPILIVAVFTVAALMMVPVTLLIIASVIVFGPLVGAGYALLGSVLSSLSGYFIGSLLGRDAIMGLTHGKVKRISQRLATRGVFTIVVLRIVPVAPFTIINLVAGASHIGLRDFFWGTSLGITPGIITIALLTDRARATLIDPEPATIVMLIALAIIVVLASYYLSRYLLKYHSK